ncbi:MAG: hypothetical protein LBI61_03110 [Puniceicoccales bacterium]|jgi:hypothetical protein|nr:hypothetical protein [Puniceicoccales bacterium]
MRLKKLMACMVPVFVFSGCQHGGTNFSASVPDRSIVEIVADKSVAMAMNECFFDLGSPTVYPKYRRVSQMVRELNLSSNPFSPKTSKLLEKIPALHGNSAAYADGAEEYANLIWGPNESVIFEKQRELQSVADKFLTVEYLKKICDFYGAQFPKNYHAKVYLMPMLGENGFATLLGEDKIFLNVMPCDISTHLGVIAHECCHLAFHRKNKAKMGKFFQNHPSGIGNIVFGAMDEALAVAIGNRLFRQSIDGIDEECAYTYDYIDNFSKKLKPLVEQYLSFGKEMDENFFEESMVLFCEANPEAQNNLDILMQSVIFFTNKKNFLQHAMNVAHASGFLIKEFLVKSLNSKVESRKTFALQIYILGNGESHKDFPQEGNCLRVKKSADGKITIVIRADDEETIRGAFKYLHNNPIVEQSFAVAL